MNFYQFPQLMGYCQNPMGYNQMPMANMMGMPMMPMNPNGSGMTSMPMGPMGQMGSQGATEESYIENILRLNLGKTVSVYMNFENSQWGSKIFKGTLEAAGKDHIIISDSTTNMRYLLLSIYLNYVTFDEEINYYYPLHPQQGQNQK